MEKYSVEEFHKALEVVMSTIRKCEGIQPKFAEGTSQHTLLKNRIKAMYISKSLIANEIDIDQYTKDELIEALRPVSSIISKCEKAQSKYVEGNPHFIRFKNIIDAMYLSKSLITVEIGRRE